MLAVLLPLSSMVVDEAVGLTDIASSAEDIFSSTVRGCSMCQRVAAMSPQQQVVFFTLVTATFATMLVVYLLYRVRAKMVPGIIFPREQLPWFGALLSVNKNFHRMSEWKRDVVTRTLEETRQKDMIAAMKRNATAEEVEASSKPREVSKLSQRTRKLALVAASPRSKLCSTCG
jgi:hypothetical protein